MNIISSIEAMALAEKTGKIDERDKKFIVKDDVCMHGDYKLPVTMWGTYKSAVNMYGTYEGLVTMNGTYEGLVTMNGDYNGLAMDGDFRKAYVMMNGTYKHLTMEGDFERIYTNQKLIAEIARFAGIPVIISLEYLKEPFSP